MQDESCDPPWVSEEWIITDRDERMKKAEQSVWGNGRESN